MKPMVLFDFDGAELKRRRQEAGLTQAQLARLVGRSTASLSHYESHFSRPPTAAVLALSAALACEPGALFSPVPEQEDAMT
jgi:transcriptional regulator with XRE-family HTH domain